MITINNYSEEITKFNISAFPAPLLAGHDFFIKATKAGVDLSAYHSSPGVKHTLDLYLLKVNQFIRDSKKEKTNVQAKPGNKERKKDEREISKLKPKMTEGANETKQPVFIERIPEELRFIKRYINLNGKTKTKEDLLRFINSLQKTILEKKIRKTSVYANQIKEIQEKLIQVYNTMKSKIKIELKEETLNRLKEIAGEKKVMPSIGFIKRYISLNGKLGVKEKAKSLLKQINSAIDKRKITDNDTYISEIHELKANLKAFITSRDQSTLKIEKTELNGLEGILGCSCPSYNGLGEVPAIMNSMDFANMKFNTLGFNGKWLSLIGDPSSNFTAMVYGKPKFGKSILCVDFAGYLARQHGKVLYVAKEEGLDMTLQKKLQDKNVKHPNLFVTGELPGSLTSYDFIFLDSVNKIGLTPDDISHLRKSNPTKSFIFVFQSTKGGEFRGANTFQHDVDVVIEVPEPGKAVQMGRFNQGGEMAIFE